MTYAIKIKYNAGTMREPNDQWQREYLSRASDYMPALSDPMEGMKELYAKNKPRSPLKSFWLRKYLP